MYIMPVQEARTLRLRVAVSRAFWGGLKRRLLDSVDGMEASRLQKELFEERCICQGVVIRISPCQFVIFSIFLMFARKRNLVSLQAG